MYIKIVSFYQNIRSLGPLLEPYIEAFSDKSL